MSSSRRLRTIIVRLSPIRLVVCIALGLWLGFVAILLTSWGLYKYAFDAPLALSNAAPPAPAATRPQPPAGQSPMLEQYQENLHEQALRQAEDSARSNAANLANPKCQFWLQQAQTAPTEKSRANVARFCD